MPSLEELQALMRSRLTAVGISVDGGVPTRRNHDRAAQSFSQRIVWAHQQRVPDSTANNICLAFTFTGVVDETALRRALLGVVERHEILRTTYHTDDDGSYYQQIHTDLPIRVQTLDLDDAPASTERLSELIAEAATEPFDLAGESSIRLTFVRLTADADGQPRLAVVIAMQHIIWDGMTLPAMARDVERFYAQAIANPDGALEIPPLSSQVADFAEWEQDRFAADDHASDTAFWEDQFRDISTTVLPYDRRPESVSERSARMDRQLSDHAESVLRSLSSELRVPPFSVFLAVYYLALRRITGQRDILIGTTVANREEVGMEALIGNFSNSIALRVGTDGATFADLVAEVRAVTDSAFGHRTFPFEHLVEVARRITGDPQAQPFDTLVLFIDQELQGPQLPGVSSTWELAHKGRALLPLAVETFMHADRTEVQISYQIDLFEPSTVERIHDNIEQVLSDATADRPLSDLLPADLVTSGGVQV